MGLTVFYLSVYLSNGEMIEKWAHNLYTLMSLLKILFSSVLKIFMTSMIFILGEWHLL